MFLELKTTCGERLVRLRNPSFPATRRTPTRSRFSVLFPCGEACPKAVSPSSFFHPRKKTNSIEWSRAVNGGKLVGAIRYVNKHRRRGPWQVLCDNDSFLAKSAAAHERASVSLWRVPPKSPDLNPVEKYWSWLRRRLRFLDLKDVAAGRPVPGKTAYIRRVRAVCRSRQSQKVARACALGLRRVCQEVIRKKGARARS